MVSWVDLRGEGKSAGRLSVCATAGLSWNSCGSWPPWKESLLSRCDSLFVTVCGDTGGEGGGRAESGKDCLVSVVDTIGDGRLCE